MVATFALRGQYKLYQVLGLGTELKTRQARRAHPSAYRVVEYPRLVLVTSTVVRVGASYAAKLRSRAYEPELQREKPKYKYKILVKPATQAASAVDKYMGSARSAAAPFCRCSSPRTHDGGVRVLWHGDREAAAFDDGPKCHCEGSS